MTELRRIRGPLSEEQLGWLADVYGPVSPRYASREYLRHQFVDNPFGWSAHVFVLDGERPVGHAGAVPFRARLGDERLVVGKIEGIVVGSEYRGRRPDGGSTATDMLAAMYAFAHECGIPLLFGVAPPGVDRVHVRAGCTQVEVDAPSRVLVAATGAFPGSRRRRLAAAGLGAAQRSLVAGAAASTRVASGQPRRGALEKPTPGDAELARADPSPDAWTISGEDEWDWYVGSGLLRTLEIPGRFGSRALVRVAHGEPLQIVAWRPRRHGLRPAVLLLGALARLAREHGAPTLRFQPWAGACGDGGLARACALLGFVTRPEVGLVLHGDEHALAAPLRLTPFFYVTF